MDIGIHLGNPEAVERGPLRLVVFGRTGSIQVAIWGAADDLDAIRLASAHLPAAQFTEDERDTILVPRGRLLKADVLVEVVPETHPLFSELRARALA